MIKKEENSAQGLKKASERLVRALKLPDLYRNVLETSLSFEESRDFVDYVRNSPISFETLPEFIRELFEGYVHQVQQIIETDVLKCFEKPPEECKRSFSLAPNDRKIEIPIQSPTLNSLTAGNNIFLLPKKSAFKEKMLFDAKNRMEYIVFSLGGKSSKEEADSRRKLLAHSREFIHFLSSWDSSDFSRLAVIEGYELEQDCKDICQFSGYLFLYGWTVFINIQTGRFLDNAFLEETMQTLFNSGVNQFCFFWDAESVQKIGLESIDFLLRCIRPYSKSKILYTLENTPISRKTLQDLLALKGYNYLRPNLFVLPKEGLETKERTKAGVSRFHKFLTKIKLSNTGLLKIENRDGTSFDIADLYSDHWKEDILDYFNNSINTK